MFRNVRWYTFEGPWPESEDKLSEALQKAAFRPCGPLTERSNGWEAVAADVSESLARRVAGADLLRLGSQSRVLPHAAVNEELEMRVAEYRKKAGEEPSSRQKRRFKNDARDELLPKALLKSDRINGFVDPKEHLIGIDSGQEANAERFLRRLTAAVDGLSIKPLQFANPLEQFLGKVLFGDCPSQFVAGRECRLQDLTDPKAIVRCMNVDLSDPTFRRNIADGMRLTHLAIEYDNVASLVLDMDGNITKLKFIGDEDEAELESATERLDADFVLLTGVLRNLLKDLSKQHGKTA